MNTSAQLWIPYGRWVAEILDGRPENEPAVVWQDRPYSTRQLAGRASQFVQSFGSLGLVPGDGVGLLAYNSFDYLALMIAIPVAGLRYTPLHPLGTADDHLFVVQDADLGAVVFDPSIATESARAIADAIGESHLLTTGPSTIGQDLFAMADRFAPEELQPREAPDGIAAIMYTGGTTGRPKGVVWRDNSLLGMFLLNLEAFDLPATPRAVISTPLSHGSMMFVFPVLSRGGTAILLREFEAEQWLDTAERYRANTTWLIPSALYSVMDSPSFAQRDLSSFETIVYGGAAISTERLKDAIAHFGPILVQNYGQTETTNITALSKRDHLDPNRLLSAGRPMFGVDIRIMNAAGNELPRGAVGEVLVRTPNAMSGYWRRPDEDDRTLTGGWLRTGDIAYRDEDGYLYLVDRDKDVVQLGDQRIYTRQVEELLVAHESVSVAAVFPVPDANGQDTVAAAVAIRPGHTTTVADLQEHVAAAGDDSLVPCDVMILGELPLTAVGKIDKKALRETYAARHDARSTD